MSFRIRPALAGLALALLAAGCSEKSARQLRPASQEPRGKAAGQLVQGYTETSTPAEADPAETGPGLIGSAISAPPVREITLDEIRQRMANNTAHILDIRSAREFEGGHMRGAVNVPASQVEARLGDIARQFATSDLIIIYCGSPDCDSSEMVYEILSSQGYENVRVFKPGWETLRKAKDLH